MITRIEQRVIQGQERIVTIDRELARLERWDGQERYDAAASELRVIAAAFAAAEEQAGSPEPTAAPAPEEADLATTLLALAQADRADDDGGWAPVIPPAPASLAWMAAQEAPVEPSACPTPLPARPAAARRPIAPMPASGETFQQLSLFG